VPEASRVDLLDLLDRFDRFEFPHALHTMLRLDPVNGHRYLEGWIALNERAVRLCAVALAQDETTDEATLAAEVAVERRAHRAQLTADRDRYAQAAEEARAVRTQLGP
jgi:hypothetical protein